MRAMVYRGPYKVRVEEHQPLDVLIVAGPWLAGAGLLYAGGRAVSGLVRRWKRG